MKQGFRPHLSKDELRYYGVNACWAIWKNRPKDIIRVYILRSQEKLFAEIIKGCALQRKSYHLVEERELEKLTDSGHHQGICIVAKEKKILSERDFFHSKPSHGLILFLDEVSNPHNLGAILRTCAHFNIKTICAFQDIPRIPPSAYRTSEGGAEYTSVVKIADVDSFFTKIKKTGYQVFGLDPTPQSIPLYRKRLQGDIVLVLGSEVKGISPIVRSHLDASLTIPGTGAVESLNVSVAAAIACSEFQRQNEEKNARIVKTSSHETSNTK